MKKINLKSIKTEELLSRDQLKQIMGGFTGSGGSGTGVVCSATASCGDGRTLSCNGYANGCAGVDGPNGYVACQTQDGTMKTTRC